MIHTRDAVLRQAGGTWSPQSDRLDIRHCASKVPVQLFGCHSAFFSPLNFFFFLMISRLREGITQNYTVTLL